MTSLFVAAACLVTDPPGDLPRLPETRPTIVRGSVVPSASSVLGVWPAIFIVPVELANPLADVELHPYIDYNAASGAGLQDIVVSRFEAANTTGRVRRVQVVLAPPADLDRCHTIEILVGFRFAPNVRSPAEPPGGDIVTWFYSPSGDLAGCSVLDAGIDAGRRDAGVEAGDGSLR